MEGVTTVLVGYVLLCVALPHLVKNKTQYYIALFGVVAILLLDSLSNFGAEGFQHFVKALDGLIQIVSLIALVLACGGLSPRQLAGEMGDALEVIRRGGEEKETIIPLGPEAYAAMAAKARADAANAPAAPAEQPKTVYHPDTSTEESSIPLE
jgi:hypothetical protein